MQPTQFSEGYLFSRTAQRQYTEDSQSIFKKHIDILGEILEFRLGTVSDKCHCVQGSDVFLPLSDLKKKRHGVPSHSC